MSESLRMALGITDYQAPPWIINMQRYGAPPSYPTLRILGSTLPFSQLTSYSVINKFSSNRLNGIFITKTVNA